MLDTEMPCTVNTEPAETIIEPAEDIQVEIEDVSDFQNDVAEQEVVESEDLEGVAESLEAYSQLLKQAGDKGITKQSAAMMRIGMKQIDARLNIKREALSLEGFKTCTMRDGLQTTTVSMEDVKERVKELGKRIVEFIARLIERAKAIYQKLAGPKVKTQKAAQQLIAASRAFPAYPGGKMRGSVPENVSEDLKKKAAEIKERKGDIDEESKKIRIEDTTNIVADGENTYDTITTEKAYAVFLYDRLPKALMSVMKFAKDNVGKGDASEYIESVLDHTHSEMTKVVQASIGQDFLPGSIRLSWDMENLGFKIIQGTDSNGPIEVDLRPASAITKFAQECETVLAVMTDDASVNRHNGELQQLSDSLGAKLVTELDDPAVFGAITSLITKIRSLDVLAQVERQIVTSVFAKLAIAKHELTKY